MNREVDFEIATIQHVIERMPNPDWKMESALNRDLYIIGASLDGCAEYTIDGQIYRIKKGDLIMLRPGMVRAARSLADDPWHFVSIGCRLRFPGPEASAAFHELPVHFQEVPEAVLRTCKELAHIWNGHSRYHVLMVKGLINKIIKRR